MRVIFHELGVHREGVFDVFLEMKIQDKHTPFSTDIHAQVVGIVIQLECVVVIVVAVEFEMLLLLGDIVIVVVEKVAAVVVDSVSELFDSLLDAFDVQHIGHV